MGGTIYIHGDYSAKTNIQPHNGMIPVPIELNIDFYNLLFLINTTCVKYQVSMRNVCCIVGMLKS